MKNLFTIAIFGALAWFLWSKFVKRNRTEVDESFDIVRDGQRRGEVANLLNIIHNPPVAMIGTQPLTAASINPFSGIGPEGVTQSLPKFASGTDNGATITEFAEPLEPLGSQSVPRNWLLN